MRQRDESIHTIKKTVKETIPFASSSSSSSGSSVPPSVAVATLCALLSLGVLTTIASSSSPLCCVNSLISLSPLFGVVRCWCCSSRSRTGSMTFRFRPRRPKARAAGGGSGVLGGDGVERRRRVAMSSSMYWSWGSINSERNQGWTARFWSGFGEGVG